MPKVKYPIFKGLHRGQEGFTLIELLIVIAILGTIAAVVVLNVGGFLSRGNLEAANTELHQATTAVIALMTEAGGSQLGAQVTGWQGESGKVTITYGGTTYDAHNYLVAGTAAKFKAKYTVEKDGHISAGVLTGVTSPWTGIEWDDTNLCWKKTPAT